MPKNVAIILAGGSGKRFDSKIPKQFQKLVNNRIIDYSIKKFLNNESISDIVIVSHEDWVDLMQKEYSECIVVKGGATRQESSMIGLAACPTNIDNVLIHDSARPFITNKIILDSIKMLKKYDAINISIPSSDTVIHVKDNLVNFVLEREEIFLSQTPQSFKYDVILKAHNSTNKKNVSDDMQLIKDLNIRCYNLTGSKYNIKITHQIDIEIAKSLIRNGKIKEDM